MPVDNDAKSWRLRAVFADQLTLILPLFENAQIDTFFTPFALTFCADRIAVVRIAGISLLSNILALFINTEWNDFKAQNEADETMEPLEPPTCRPLSTSLLKEIRAGFLNTRCWRRRQRLYAYAIVDAICLRKYTHNSVSDVFFICCYKIC
jgi:hypothetical protein